MTFFMACSKLEAMAIYVVKSANIKNIMSVGLQIKNFERLRVSVVWLLPSQLGQKPKDRNFSKVFSYK